jgi:soluble cytochrome b562
MKKSIIVLSIATILTGCASEQQANPLAELTQQQKKEEVQEAESTMSNEEFYSLVQSIPTPLQSTALIQALDFDYDESILHKSEDVEKITNWFGYAANLGIYGGDMGYANLYGETKKSMDYLNTVRKLADKLKIGQFFDFSTIKELANSKENLDELINTSQMNFQKMNDYLQKQGRGKVSVAILFGGWAEGLYIACEINKSLNSPILEEFIGEQKYALETIDLLIDQYKSDKYFKDFRTDFDALVEAYDDVENLFIEGEMVETEDENGELVFEDTSTSEVIITKGDVKKITAAINNLRDNLIK